MQQPPELMTLVFAALDHAIAAVGRRDRPLVPFVMQSAHGPVRLHRFAASTLEESLAEARAFARDLGPDAAVVALAYGGVLVDDGVPRDAIFVQVHAHGRATSVVYAQRYARTDAGVQEVDHVELVEAEERPLVGV